VRRKGASFWYTPEQENTAHVDYFSVEFGLALRMERELTDDESQISSTYSLPAAIRIGAFIIGTFLGLIILSIATGPLIWALIRYGQEPPDITLCMDRNLSYGFIGNSDFYGLGIRLGVYIQWGTQIIANVLMPGERRSAAGAGLTFLIALLLAMLLAIFQHQCTYAIEIFIIQLIFWPGALITILPFVTTFQAFGRDQYKGLAYGFQLLYTIMLVPTLWFWIRLATVGEKDFVPTPGGTAFFVVAIVTGPSIHRASIACVVLWCWFTFFDLTIRYINRGSTGIWRKIYRVTEPITPGGILNFAFAVAIFFSIKLSAFFHHMVRGPRLRQALGIINLKEVPDSIYTEHVVFL
jgi:hypothetical protein